MIYLLLSILSSSAIYVIFKLFGRFKVDSLSALVMNYIIACLLGLLTGPEIQSFKEIVHTDWFPGAVILGCLFILVFNLMIITTRRNGISVVSVASKMSVVLSVVFVIFYYDEDPGIIKILGILLALTAVYLVSVKDQESKSLKKSGLIFPLLVFLGSGIIESGLKFLETEFVGKSEVAIFSSSIFAVAALVGILLILMRYLLRGTAVKSRDLLGGMILGIPNYYSVYFFIQALRIPNFSGSTVFVLNNVSIVLFSTLLGLIFFREKLFFKNWAGIVLAVISIILVSYSTGI